MMEMCIIPVEESVVQTEAPTRPQESVPLEKASFSKTEFSLLFEHTSPILSELFRL